MIGTRKVTIRLEISEDEARTIYDALHVALQAKHHVEKFGMGGWELVKFPQGGDMIKMMRDVARVCEWGEDHG